jgi:hypothetical protein
MPAPPSRSSLFPTGPLAPATFKTLLAQWYDYMLPLLGNTGNAADARAALGAAADADVLKLSGAQTVSGVKTFSDRPIIPDATAAQNPVSKAQLDAATAAIYRGITRQSVLSGPVDAEGLPSFGGTTGSTTVTASGTLVVAAAGGYGAQGAIDRVGVISNPSWTGLTTNGTMYLFLTVAADGTCTTGSSTVAPNYIDGNGYSVANNTWSFSKSEMVGKLGDGANANQVWRVYVGQVTVSGGVVSAITWYALRGRYESAWFAVSANTTYAKNHNLGMPVLDYCVLFSESSSGTNARRPVDRTSSSSIGMYISAIGATGVTVNTSANVALSLSDTVITSGYYKIICSRGW